MKYPDLEGKTEKHLLFRRFCRIELDQSVPDAVTLGRFRAALDGRMDKLLAFCSNVAFGFVSLTVIAAWVPCRAWAEPVNRSACGAKPTSCFRVPT